MRNIKEYTTPNGNTLYYSVDYDLGGYNYFTSGNRRRGYYISVQRMRNQFEAFTGLENPRGAVRRIMFEVSRQSAKYLARAEEQAEEAVKRIVAEYNAAGYAI